MKSEIHRRKNSLAGVDRPALHLQTGEGKSVWMNGDLYTRLIGSEETQEKIWFCRINDGKLAKIAVIIF
ncbi:hypothetical protein [Xenorhabdus bovienii]|uniref:hypothetical protein n=1 Tax=Xenorhabdus bovienii TaxID=40576 RepID=UPI00056FB437|nr:hypothetical protein [Xenorhabdus bovienii]